MNVEKRSLWFWIVAGSVVAIIAATLTAREFGFRMADTEADKALLVALFAGAFAVSLWAVTRFRGFLPWLLFGAVVVVGGLATILGVARATRFAEPDQIMTAWNVESRRYEVREFDVANVFDHIQIYDLVVRDGRFPYVERSLGRYFTDERDYTDPVPPHFEWQSNDDRVSVVVSRRGEKVGELPWP